MESIFRSGAAVEAFRRYDEIKENAYIWEKIYKMGVSF